MILSTVFISACAEPIAQKINGLQPKYVGFGKIHTTFNGESFTGDFAFTGDNSSFSVEVFAFGTIILKAEEHNGKTVYYYMGNKYEESFILQSFIPIKFKRLKELLIQISEGKNIDLEEGPYKIKTDINDNGKVIQIKNEEREGITIMLEANK